MFTLTMIVPQAYNNNIYIYNTWMMYIARTAYIIFIYCRLTHTSHINLLTHSGRHMWLYI